MRKVFVLLWLAVCVHATAQPVDAGAAGKAEVVAREWLALVDAGQYTASWERTAVPFQAAVSRADWEKTARSVRLPVGSVEKRELLSANVTDHLPGAPPGKYVVVQFTSQFANRNDATETVIPLLDKEGNWKVSGYFIQ